MAFVALILSLGMVTLSFAALEKGESPDERKDKKFTCNRNALACRAFRTGFTGGVVRKVLSFIRGMPVLSASFIFGRSVILNGGGVGAQLFNSFYLLFLSVAVSIPIAVGAGVYLAEYAGYQADADHP